MSNSIVKIVFICVKITLVIIFMLMGMHANYVRTNRMNSIFKLFLVFIVVLLALGVYEFVPFFNHMLPFLYICMVMIGFTHVASLQIFLDKAKQYQDFKVTEQMKKKIWIFYGLLIICLCISPLPIVGAYCTKDRLAYPICFMILLYTWVFVSSTGIHWVNKNFYMDMDAVKDIDKEEINQSLLQSKNLPLNASEMINVKKPLTASDLTDVKAVQNQE